MSGSNLQTFKETTAVQYIFLARRAVTACNVQLHSIYSTLKCLQLQTSFICVRDGPWSAFVQRDMGNVALDTCGSDVILSYVFDKDNFYPKCFKDFPHVDYASMISFALGSVSIIWINIQITFRFSNSMYVCLYVCRNCLSLIFYLFNFFVSFRL